jgi:hypothetical protein
MASSASFLTAAALASCLETDGPFSRACLCDDSAIEEKEKKAGKSKSTIECFFIAQRYNRGQKNKPFHPAETTAGLRQQQQSFQLTCLRFANP